MQTLDFKSRNEDLMLGNSAGANQGLAGSERIAGYRNLPRGRNYRLNQEGAVQCTD